MRVKTDFKEIDELVDDLNKLKRSAYPKATRNTLNKAAFSAQRIARKDIGGGMTLRNKFTQRSILVDKARGLNPRNQIALVGSTADYMETQEFGGSKSRRGKVGIGIPTGYSSGEGENATPRKKLPRRPNQVANIRLSARKPRARSRKRRNIAKVRLARQTNSRFVFLHLRRSKGIFKVVGGKRNPKIKMVHNLSKTRVRIPKNPWLRPAAEKAQRLMPSFFRESLNAEINRLNLFR